MTRLDVPPSDNLVPLSGGPPWYTTEQYTGLARVTSRPRREVYIGVIDRSVDVHASSVHGHVRNPKEIPGNGIDDDHNGYTDDAWGWNFVTSSPQVWQTTGAGSTADHGNMVVNAILAPRTAPTWGAFPDAYVVPAVVSDDDDVPLSNTIDALCYMLSLRMTGLDLVVVNLSLSFCRHSMPADDEIALRQVIRALGDHQVLVVGAARNYDMDCGHHPCCCLATSAELDSSAVYGCCTDHDRCPALPTALDLPNVLGVVGVSTGSFCLGTARNSMCPGHGAQTMDLMGPGAAVPSRGRNSRFLWGAGASAAAPVVSAIAAMVVAHDTSSAPPRGSELRRRLLRSTVVPPIQDIAGRTCSGGMVNAPRALAGEGDAGALCPDMP